MEPLGKKLQQTRLAKSISLEEASRVTKIRASRIEEIEAEDFSSFPSLAYAKGFLLIYGKFLEVDVTPYLDAFETSNRVTVDGYSYLQGEGGGGAPSPIVRRQPAKRPALFPLFIAVGVLVVGLYLMKLFLNIQRIVPPGGGAPGTAAASATPSPENIVAPRAIPVETPAAAVPSSTPLPTATEETPRSAPTEPEVRRAEPVRPEELPRPKVTPPPDVAVAMPQTSSPPNVAENPIMATPSPRVPAALPEITASPVVTAISFKASPSPVAAATFPTPSPPPVAAAVSPEPALSPMVAATSPRPTPSPIVVAVLTKKPVPSPSATASPKPSPSPTASIARVQITPVRKTFVRVIVDNNAAHPAFEGWLAPSDPPLSFRAQHVSVRAFERGAIQITRNGTPVRASDSNVHVE